MWFWLGGHRRIYGKIKYCCENSDIQTDKRILPIDNNNIIKEKVSINLDAFFCEKLLKLILNSFRLITGRLKYKRI